MSVYNRPLFRQAGGPVASSMVGPPLSDENYDKPFPDEPFQGERNIPLSSRVFVAMSRMVEPGDTASTPEQALQEAANNLPSARTEKEVDEIKLATQQFFLEFASKAGIPVQKQMEILNSPLAKSIQNFKLAPPNMRFQRGVEAGFIDSPQKRAMGGEMMASEQMMAASPAQQLPPEAAMLQEVEQTSAAQGQELGKAYAEQMMQGIDAAQSTEELINAFRGNEMPLDARRDELADYVGQGDADQTPESVLAMVQPVIMMTEEGAMNSGIGNLMQQLTGDIDMITEGGQPTDMGQGVGSLMMAGAPEAPAPQNFRQGGAVQKFREGGFAFSSDNVSENYKDLIPLFEKITDADVRARQVEEDKVMDQGQALLALARGGLRLAAGDPKTGGSFASQLGSAFEPTAGEIALLGAEARKRERAFDAEDRALRLAALQGAMTVEQQAVADRQALAIARLKARDRNASFEFLYKDGDVKAVDLTAPDAETQVQNFISQGYTDVAPPTSGTFGTSLEGRSLALFSDDDMVQALEDYYAGIETPKTRSASAAYTVISRPQYDSITQRYTKAIVPEFLQAARKRGERRLEQRRASAAPDQTTTEEVVVTGTSDEPTQAPTGTFFDEVPPPPEKTRVMSNEELMMVGVDNPETLTGQALEAYQGNLEKATGLPSGAVNFYEYLVSQASDILNKPFDTRMQGGQRTRTGRNVLRGIQIELENFVLADEGQTRPMAAELERIYKQLPEPDAFTDDFEMYDGLKKWRNYVIKEVQHSQRVIARGEVEGKAGKETVEQNLNRRDLGINTILPILNAAIFSYENQGNMLSDQEKAQRRPMSEFRNRSS